MRVLVLFAHPVETSFVAEVHRVVVRSLAEGGHEVDDCDLYAEGFDPLLSRRERIDYHDPAVNRRTVEPYVERLLSAEARVLVHPVWNFGFPAILKGFFDRVLLPGVSFDLIDGKLRPSLHNIRKLAAVVTYGGERWRALLVGDPPRKIVKRVVRAVVHPGVRTRYIALYGMNRDVEADRRAFLRRVATEMRRF
jgi:putative NADPH-quinone reductase